MAARIGSSVCLMAALVLMPSVSRGQQPQDQPDGTKADVMFVLDITASMKFAIDGVETGLERILKKLKDREIDAHVGLTVFRDRDAGNGGKPTPNDKIAAIKGDPFTFKFKDGNHFTDSSKEYRGIVSKIKAEGGGDIPENSLEGIKHAAAAGGTRKGVARLIVLITDAPPHPGPTLEKRIEESRKALVEHKYHHVYLMTTTDQRALYQRVWDKAGGVDGAWFQIATPAASFAKLLDDITDQAIVDVLKHKK